MIARETCPACGRAGAALVADLPYDAPPISGYLREFYRSCPGCDFSALAGCRFQLANCPQCGCIHQSNVPDESYLGRFYSDGLYGGTAPDNTPTQPYEVEQVIRELMMVVRFLQPGVPRPRVLDFGTGNGRWARLAAASGVETHACDLSPHAFPALEQQGITCHVLDALPEGRFDLVNAEQVFEHLVYPAAEARRLARALRPGGILKIGVPRDPVLRQKLRQPDWLAPKNSPASLNAVAPIEHLNHFEPASLLALGAAAGLDALATDGWDLINPAAPRPNGLRRRVGAWLRRQRGDFYRPYHPLTQTIFFRKPPA